MMLVNPCAIRPLIPKAIFITHCCVESMAFPSMVFHSNRFFNDCCLFRQQLSAAYLLKLFLLPQRARAYSLVFVQLACWHTDVSRWRGVQPWLLSPFHKRRYCWCAHMSPPANFECSHLVVLVPFCIICSLHLIASLIFASHLATGMIHAIAIISRLSCLQGTRGLFKYFPKNALLSFCCKTKSAFHVPCAGWLILSCSALAHTYDFKNFLSLIQVFCCKTFIMLCYDISYSCLCVQSPECAHLSPSTCKLLLIFLHLILCCPSPYCIPHAIIECRMTILKRSPASMHGFLHMKTARFVRWHHSLPTFNMT